MIKHAIYLLMESADPNHATLELRTNLSPLQNYRFERSLHGEYVLHVPEPVIPVASGTVHELMAVAHDVFGVPAEADWRYLGDRSHAYPIQDAARLPEKKS